MHCVCGLVQNVKSKLSVVVPLLNEFAALPALVAALDSLNAEQVVIVDGGSDDGSFEWLVQNWCLESPQHNSVDPIKTNRSKCLLQSAAGRATQMNAGAAKCFGDVIVFLHADTLLPAGAKQEIMQACNQKLLWGRFDVQFSEPNNYPRSMRVIAAFINMRSRLSGIATGDQAIFIEANLFKLIRGFADLPLMEDVEISKTLKLHCRPYCSRMKVITSPRRWEQRGVVRTVLLMWRYRLAYFLGFSVEALAASYTKVR